MKNPIAILRLAAFFVSMATMTAGAAVITTGQEEATLPPTVNPKTTLTAVPNSSYRVMGLDFLSDGRAVVLVTVSSLGQGDIVAASVDQALYIASGFSRTGSMSGVTYTKIVDQLTGPPPGVVVVNDTVYFMDRTAFYRVNSLNPTGGTNKNVNATRIIDAPTSDSTYNWNTRGISGHQFIFTPQYYNGRFYTAYSGSIARGGRSDAPPTSTLSGGVLSWDKNTIVASNATNSGYRREAGGLRSCNGIAGNRMGTFLIADNQGSFKPQNPVYLYKTGQPMRTYGQRQATNANAAGAGGINNTQRNWAEDLPYQPPLIWIPDNVQQSNSQPLYLDRGPYKGDWIIGDVNAPGLGRLHIDEVDNTGYYQASFHLFTSGIDSPGGTAPSKAINRLAWSPDSAIYVGTLMERGDWPSGAPGPMTRITFKDTAVFEILALRSRKSADGNANGVELFFSQPINPSTATAGNFSLFQMGVVLTANYGCVGSNGRPCFSQVPQVTGVSVSNDNRKVFLSIATPDTSIGAAHIGVDEVGNNPLGTWGGAGKQDRTLRVIVSSNLKSATGGTLLYDRSWMGWHYQAAKRFDPANTDISPVNVKGAGSEGKYLSAAVSSRLLGGMLNVQVTLPGRYTVSVYGMNGALRAQKTGLGAGEFHFNAETLGRGVHILNVKQGAKVYSKTVTL